MIDQIYSLNNWTKSAARNYLQYINKSHICIYINFDLSLVRPLWIVRVD